MSVRKTIQNKPIKTVKLLGIRTAQETMTFSTVNFSLYSFWVEYSNGTTETVEVSPQNPYDKRKKEKAIFDKLMAIANSTPNPINSDFQKQNTVYEAQNQTTSNILDELKKLKDLYDAGVISQDIYDNQREQLLERLTISGTASSPKVNYNLTIRRKKPRPMGEGITKIIVDGITKEDVNIDSVNTLLLPLGTHEIYFKRAAVKSAVITVTISASSQFTIEYNPGVFKIEARLL